MEPLTFPQAKQIAHAAGITRPAWVVLLQKVSEGSCTVGDLTHELSLSQQSVRMALAFFCGKKICRIKQWLRPKGSGSPSPVYVLGDGCNAPKPGKTSRVVRNRRYWAKHKTKIALKRNVKLNGCVNMFAQLINRTGVRHANDC